MKKISRSDIHLRHETLRFNNDEVAYSELHNSKWWEHTENDVARLFKMDEQCALLPIILHVDDTILDATSKYKVKPISMSLGIFSAVHRVPSFTKS